VRTCGTSSPPKRFQRHDHIRSLPRRRKRPPGLNDELRLPDSNASDDTSISPTLPLDILLYSVSSIRSRMIGEMGLFPDRPISLLLVLLVSESSPIVHIHFRTGFWAWSRGLFMTQFRFHSLLYLALLFASYLL
jgi:hypothetical protein